MWRLTWIVVGLLFASVVAAADVAVQWTNPTTRVDGTVLPVGELRGTRIEHGTCNADGTFGTANGAALAAAGATALTIQLPAGIHCIRAYARASDGAGGMLESSATNPVAKQILLAPPASPIGLTAAQMTAYTLVKAQDRLVMLPVGTVPGDTGCISSQVAIVDEVVYHAVPVAAVAWSGSVRPVVVFARCS